MVWFSNGESYQGQILVVYTCTVDQSKLTTSPGCDVRYDFLIKRCSTRFYSHLFCMGGSIYI